MIGTAFDAIYADWWAEALAIGGVTAATIVVLLGLARALHLELARRCRAERIARDSGEQFRMLAENVSDVIVRLDLDGVRRYVSPSAREVLRYTPEEMLNAGRWSDFVHPEDQAIPGAIQATLRAGTDQTTVAYRVFKKCGTEIWLEARIRLVRDAVTGEPSEMIAVARDVTSRYTADRNSNALPALTD